MKKRILSPILAASLAVMLMAGSGAAMTVMASETDEGEEETAGAETAEDEAAEADGQEDTGEATAEASDGQEDAGEDEDLDALKYMGPGPVVMDDQMAANYVADLIDSLCEDDWSEDTLEQCEEARAAWDSLSNKAKSMVIGDYADSDYFGRDTGDASLDYPLNGDDIGENEILVVSVGTAYNNTRANDIKGIEDALAEAYPDWSVRRAFISQSVINHIYARNGELIDNLDQALQRAVDNEVKNLVIQPTMLLHGEQYQAMMDVVGEYEDKFETLAVAEPLLGEPGDSEDSVNDDEQAVAKAVVAQAVKDSKYDTLDEMAADGTALVLAGSGTADEDAGISYYQMQAALEALGYDNVYIGSVEGDPIEYAAGNVPDIIYEAGYTQTIIRPLMVVSGELAEEVFGEDADSWRMYFLITGYFDDNVFSQEAGMGRIPAIQNIYVEHTGAVMPADAGATGDAD